MPNISSIIKNIRNIMRNEDQGISGDAQRLEQLGWMLFLKIIDDKDQELELIRKGYHYRDSLKTEYNGIGPKQQVNVILANPPFGAGIADGVETNFPASFRCRESADLFIILMIQLLKPGGRCAIVLPDGCITGDGYKERIREKLLTDCNLHTIVRLPQSTFHPATVSTNLLFFEKGTPTKEIWYWEHRLPEGQKSYSKTKVIQFDEFAPLIKWWDKREESEVAWKVKVGDLKKGFDLDVELKKGSFRKNINFGARMRRSRPK